MSKIFSFSSNKEAALLLPSRPKRSCKGDFGRVLCVCGSYGMAGAAFLCAKAAYRSGTGLVEIFTHESNRIILQTLLPEAIITVYTDEYSENDIIPSIEKADCIISGCGLGTSQLSRKILSDILHKRGEKSLVLDADSLNIISRNTSLLKYAKGAIITPHAKEMERLCGKSVSDILSSTAETASSFAQKHELICVLKDHETIVSDGERIYKNTSGNSGMATGGSGDVLAGIVGGLFAQIQNSNSDAFNLATLAVYLHGLSGDIAAQKFGEFSLMANYIIDNLPNAFKLTE